MQLAVEYFQKQLEFFLLECSFLCSVKNYKDVAWLFRYTRERKKREYVLGGI